MSTKNDWVLACVAFSTLLAACGGSEPTTAVLSNEYPSGSDTGAAVSMSVYKAWWSVAQFPDPVPAGQVSDPVRIVPGADYGYALLAAGWDAASGTTPTALIALRSAHELSVERGERLTFVVSKQTAIGDCAAGNPLTQADADYVTQRIFAAEFAGLSYDAASCTTSASGVAEAGAANGP